MKEIESIKEKPIGIYNWDSNNVLAGGKIKKKEKNKAVKKDKLEKHGENDLFELVGAYKHSDKRDFDYEEIIEQMDKVNEGEILKTVAERLRTGAKGPETDLE